jgi:hypothetical protein
MSALRCERVQQRRHVLGELAVAAFTRHDAGFHGDGPLRQERTVSGFEELGEVLHRRR